MYINVDIVILQAQIILKRKRKLIYIFFKLLSEQVHDTIETFSLNAEKNTNEKLLLKNVTVCKTSYIFHIILNIILYISHI